MANNYAIFTIYIMHGRCVKTASYSYFQLQLVDNFGREGHMQYLLHFNYIGMHYSSSVYVV